MCGVLDSPDLHRPSTETVWPCGRKRSRIALSHNGSVAYCDSWWSKQMLPLLASFSSIKKTHTQSTNSGQPWPCSIPWTLWLIVVEERITLSHHGYFAYSWWKNKYCFFSLFFLQRKFNQQRTCPGYWAFFTSHLWALRLMLSVQEPIAFSHNESVTKLWQLIHVFKETCFVLLRVPPGKKSTNSKHVRGLGQPCPASSEHWASVSKNRSLSHTMSLSLTVTTDWENILYCPFSYSFPPHFVDMCGVLDSPYLHRASTETQSPRTDRSLTQWVCRLLLFYSW